MKKKKILWGEWVESGRGGGGLGWGGQGGWERRIEAFVKIFFFLGGGSGRGGGWGWGAGGTVEWGSGWM